MIPEKPGYDARTTLQLWWSNNFCSKGRMEVRASDFESSRGDKTSANIFSSDNSSWPMSNFCLKLEPGYDTLVLIPATTKRYPETKASESKSVR